MTHYLRDKNNNTLAEVEVFNGDEAKPDVSAAINIKNYSNFLLEQDDINKKSKTIFVFDTISEVRGWYWEVYVATINDEPTKVITDGVVGTMMKGAADTLGVNYVTD